MKISNCVHIIILSICLQIMATTKRKKSKLIRSQKKVKTSSINSRKRRITQKGSGIVNWLINHLPFELHLPGNYEFCGPVSLIPVLDYPLVNH